MPQVTISYRDAIRRRPIQETLQGVVAPSANPAERNGSLAREVRMRSAVERVRLAPYRPGMIKWLEGQNPTLYMVLTDKLPQQIEKLWSEACPEGEFQEVLDRWVEMHAAACALYLPEADRQRERPPSG